MPEDREILDAFRQEGKEDYAFNLLVRKYSRDLYWKIRRMVFDHDDADDILQNTLIKAWKYLPDFREESRLFTWLYRIAVNETLNFLKSKRLRTMFSLSGKEKALAEKFIADPYFTGDDITRRLYAGIGKLPPKQKIVFTMRYLDQMKFDEIAQYTERDNRFRQSILSPCFHKNETIFGRRGLIQMPFGMSNHCMNDLENINRNPFTVPDGYFESLEDRVRDRIRRPASPAIKFATKVKPAFMLALMFGAIAGLDGSRPESPACCTMILQPQTIL